MREGIVLVILVCFGIADIRKRSLSLPMLAAALGAALIFRLLRASYLRGGQNIQGADWYGGWSFIGSDGDIIGVLGKYGIISDRIVFLCAFLGGGAGYFQERARIPGSLCAISCRGTVISDIGFAIEEVWYGWRQKNRRGENYER